MSVDMTKHQKEAHYWKLKIFIMFFQHDLVNYETTYENLKATIDELYCMIGLMTGNYD